MSSKKEIAIGIDLGTTNSCVAVVRNEIPEVIPNDSGDRTTPSIVTIEKDGTRIVGKEAKDMQLYKIKNTIFESKRLIGRNYTEPAVQERMLHWPFKVEADDGKANPRICVTLTAPHKHKKYFYPEEISGMIIHKMKTIAEDYLRCTIKHTVITVPAYFNDNQRQATIDAAKLAGLDVLKIMNEPTAAAFAYILKYGITRPCNTLVFDLGGGTLDLSIINSSNNRFNVVAVNGDPDLGGADFDILLYNNVISIIASQFSGAISFSNVEKRRIISKCANVKEQLSQTTTATFELIRLFNDARDFSYIYTRGEFESLISQLIKKIMALVNATLKDAKMSVEQIDNIVLVGGTSKIPAIIKSLEGLFKREIQFKVNPDEAVACGAALQAAKLMNENVPKLRRIAVVDVTPFSLGIEAEGKYMNVIINKNTALPVLVRKMYTTITDNQSALRIIIYQGEDKLTSNNTKLGEFDLVGIHEAPARVPEVWVTFDIDTNGVLHVTAMESSSKQQKKVKIITSSGRISEGDLQRIISENEVYRQKRLSINEANNTSQLLRQLCLDKIESVRNLKDFDYQAKNHCINSLNKLITHLESFSMSDENALRKISTAKSKYEFICRTLISR